MKQFKFFPFILACTLCFSTISANADNNGNGQGYGYGREKNKKETNKVPIDGGIGLLLVAGAALGAKKVLQKNQKKTSAAE